MEDSQLEKELEQKPMGLTLGDIGLAVGVTLGVGYSLLSNDAETGNYITDVIANFADNGRLAVTGLTTLGYSLGRIIDNYRK